MATGGWFCVVCCFIICHVHRKCGLFENIFMLFSFVKCWLLFRISHSQQLAADWCMKAISISYIYISHWHDQLFNFIEWLHDCVDMPHGQMLYNSVVNVLICLLQDSLNLLVLPTDNKYVCWTKTMEMSWNKTVKSCKTVSFNFKCV